MDQLAEAPAPVAPVGPHRTHGHHVARPPRHAPVIGDLPLGDEQLSGAHQVGIGPPDAGVGERLGVELLRGDDRREEAGGQASGARSGFSFFVQRAMKRSVARSTDSGSAGASGSGAGAAAAPFPGLAGLPLGLRGAGFLLDFWRVFRPVDTLSLATGFLLGPRPSGVRSTAGGNLFGVYRFLRRRFFDRFAFLVGGLTDLAHRLFGTGACTHKADIMAKGRVHNSRH